MPLDLNFNFSFNGKIANTSDLFNGNRYKLYFILFGNDSEVKRREILSRTIKPEYKVVIFDNYFESKKYQIMI